jgi:hypothetical protein
MQEPLPATMQARLMQIGGGVKIADINDFGPRFSQSCRDLVFADKLQLYNFYR